MQIQKIPIRPGGEVSDVVENQLGFHQHQSVKNLRLLKDGLWEVVKGYLDSANISNVLAAIEVTDDLSGDRFILYHVGTYIYRLDYDISNSPKTGYENETAALLFSSGVTISDVTLSASSTVRFFYHNGNIRITGTSKPLWYGYIKERTIFTDAWEEIELSTFATGKDGWAGGSATTWYDCAADADGAGMTYAPANTYALKVYRTASDNGAFQSFTVEAGRTTRLYLKVFRKAGGSGTIHVTVGSSSLGSQYADVTTTTEDEWVTLETAEFTPSVTTIYVTLLPGTAGDTAYFDYIFIEQKASISVDGWKLLKAEIDKEILELHIDNPVYIQVSTTTDIFITMLGKSLLVYDKGQYSLLNDITRDFSPSSHKVIVTNLDYEISSAKESIRRFELVLPGTSLKDNWDNERITGMSVCLFKSDANEITYTADEDDPRQMVFDEDKISFRVERDIDFTENLGQIIYNKSNFYYDTLYKNRLYLAESGVDSTVTAEDMFYEEGQRVEFNTNGNSLETIITKTFLDDNYMSTAAYIELADPVYPLLKGTDTSGGLDNIGVTITRKWRYSDTDGYKTFIGVDAENKAGQVVSAFTDIKAGTKDINPNFSHHVILENRAYCLSLEDEEQDVVRYSPLLQFDVFPNDNIIQSQVGDADQNLAIEGRDDRLLILKRNTFSQIHWSGDTYYQDIGLANHGLYASFGYIVIDTDFLHMDVDDLYLFNGISDMPLLGKHKLRKVYAANVGVNSFMQYHQAKNELYLFLDNGVILVYQMDKNEWYQRSTDITPVRGFPDYNRNVFVFDSTGFKMFGHNSTSTPDETVSWEFITRIIDNTTPEFRKMLKRISLFMKSAGNVTVLASDDSETTTYTETKTPDTSNILETMFLPKYLFKMLELKFSGSGVNTEIKSMDSYIGRWK